ADTKTNAPSMTVSWETGEPAERLLRIRVIGHAEMAPDTAWELWMLPGGEKPPVSLGLISTQETQTVVVSKALAQRLDAAWGLAMSLEPKGGSSTGAPTGPVLSAGQCVKT
ncbi:MAG: anti-sigma factor domain-containing protein, partial [Burkholderiales bacterium]